MPLLCILMRSNFLSMYISWKIVTNFLELGPSGQILINPDKVIFGYGNQKIIFFIGFRTLRIFLDQKSNCATFERWVGEGGIIRWDRASVLLLFHIFLQEILNNNIHLKQLEIIKCIQEIFKKSLNTYLIYAQSLLKSIKYPFNEWKINPGKLYF